MIDFLGRKAKMFQQNFRWRRFCDACYGVFPLYYRRSTRGSDLFSLFKQFLETEMSKNPTIIVRECIFKNQNIPVCFASRYFNHVLISGFAVDTLSACNCNG